MRVEIRVKPNNKLASIKPDLFGNLVVSVHEPAIDGRANRAVIEALAEYYQVSKSAVTIARGQTSKIKLIEITL